MESGTSTLIAGAVAAGVLPLCALYFELPAWLAAIVAAGTFIGLRLALRPSGFGLQLDAMQEARSDTVRELISDGTAALDRLNHAIPAIRDQSMHTASQALATRAQKILARLNNDPDRAMAVRRFLMFYLPNAAAIAEGWTTLERNASPSPERVAQARDVMAALGDAFSKFENDADAPELEQLDLSLKVVKDALKSDLEKVA
ncbi:MAG TPA: 5-bromo-4-chloroindolyl phosphate hydrolysis family protein [Rhizomicrobium sp.]|nr:5-bromo-4-chloroindolyl phosphate hydrolysis family protein [Rhizomicrobium sp.]